MEIERVYTTSTNESFGSIKLSLDCNIDNEGKICKEGLIQKIEVKKVSIEELISVLCFFVVSIIKSRIKHNNLSQSTMKELLGGIIELFQDYISSIPDDE